MSTNVLGIGIFSSPSETTQPSNGSVPFCNFASLIKIFFLNGLLLVQSKTFQYEKGLNIEKVEQMKLVGKELIGMANEAERLRAQVAIAEKRAQGFDPYGNPYANSNLMYPAPPMHLLAHVDSSQTSHIPVALGAMGD